MTAGLNKVTVLTSCTGLKVDTSGPVPAEELYAGQHHRRLMRGVRALRDAGTIVDVWIVSAAHGIVHGRKPLLPYERTFQGLPAAQRRRIAHELEIPQDAARVLTEATDLAVVALGDDYLDACGLQTNTHPAGPAILLCSSSAALRVPPLGDTRVIPLRAQHTREFQCGFVGLKGEIAGRLLRTLARGQLQLEDLAAPQLLLLLGRANEFATNAASTLF